MLSAICFNLDQSKTLSSGNGLNGRKLCQKRRKYCLAAFSPFPTILLNFVFIELDKTLDYGFNRKCSSSRHFFFKSYFPSCSPSLFLSVFPYPPLCLSLSLNGEIQKGISKNMYTCLAFCGQTFSFHLPQPHFQRFLQFLPHRYIGYCVGSQLTLPALVSVVCLTEVQSSVLPFLQSSKLILAPLGLFMCLVSLSICLSFCYDVLPKIGKKQIQKMPVIS